MKKEISMSDIKIEVPELLMPEVSVSLPSDIVSTFQVIAHPITHEVIVVS
jgi:hypothetical protein